MRRMLKMRYARRLEAKPTCGYMSHMSDGDLRQNLQLIVGGKTPFCYPSFCIRKELELRQKKMKGNVMDKLRKMIIVFLVIVIVGFTALSAKTVRYNGVIVSKVVRVYDGDTFFCNVDQWPDIIGKNIGIRINHIDCPELKSKSDDEKTLAVKSRLFAKSILENAKVVEMRNIQRGKYFRLIADVYCDGKSLASLLLDAKLARRYNGGKRPGWSYLENAERQR